MNLSIWLTVEVEINGRNVENQLQQEPPACVNHPEESHESGRSAICNSHIYII